MKVIDFLEEAKDDIRRGYFFYEPQDKGLGVYFRDCIYDDIENLSQYFGQHKIHFGFHRALCRTFPYAIYYRDMDNTRQIIAILDMRQSPDNIQSILQSR